MTPGEPNLSVYGLESAAGRDEVRPGLEAHRGSRRRLLEWISAVLLPRRRQHANDIAILHRVEQMIRLETSKASIEDREWLDILRARVDGFLVETAEPGRLGAGRPNQR